jgi:hypothetical protein
MNEREPLPIGRWFFLEFGFLMLKDDISSMQLIFCVQSLVELFYVEEWCWRFKNFFAASIERVSEGYQRVILEVQVDILICI